MVALARAIGAVEKLAAHLQGDRKTGARIAASALAGRCGIRARSCASRSRTRRRSPVPRVCARRARAYVTSRSSGSGRAARVVDSMMPEPYVVDGLSDAAFAARTMAERTIGSAIVTESDEGRSRAVP